jgi:OmcA/MtrC family decaheme c-type cytochrome
MTKRGKGARFWFRLIVPALLLALSGALVSAPKPAFTSADKAFYADEKTIQFVRPGLEIKITGAEIDSAGAIQVRFRLTDARGLPLDREALSTPGAVSVSFIAAYLPKGQSQYVAYTTRTQTSPITNQSAMQAAADSGGVFEKLAEGEYRYRFATRAPAGFDRTATHTIGAYGSRNLTEFELGTNYDDDVYHFVPAGGTPQGMRDVIRTATCNKCHDQMAFHGGPRRSMPLCVLCHTPQTVDPDTGNTVDMPVMIHKIHAGEWLPSVRAGKPYVIIGNRQSVNDYSTVAFPSELRSCGACHEPGAAQSDAWLRNPNRAACGACHDDVNFATGEKHVDLPQVSDNGCKNCHVPEGEIEFDASIRGAHTVPAAARDLPGTVFELVSVEDGLAGKKPTVTFRLKDRAGNPVHAMEMNRLALVLAGPASDYATYVSEDATRAAGAGGGLHRYTFQASLPADAKGTYTVGIEGYRIFYLMAGTAKQMQVRDPGVNKQIHFSVDGSAPAPRRQVVSTEKCNSCHTALALHGGNRNRVEQCVLCHNPMMTDAARRPAANLPAQGIDFRTMIHRIHTGEEGAAPFTIWGGSANDFSEVRYPGDRRNCSQCHVNGSESLPLAGPRLPVQNPRSPLHPVGAVAAACLSCHTTPEAAAHAMASTTRLGESCSACHGAGNEFSVSRVHAR